MPGIDLKLVSQREYLLSKGTHENFVISARQICAADAPGKERIADEGHFVAGQNDVTGRMSRRVQDSEPVAAGEKLISLLQSALSYRPGTRRQAEHHGLTLNLLQEWQIIAMNRHRDLERSLQVLSKGDMVDVTVGQDNVLDREAVSLNVSQDAVDLITRIDHETSLRGRVCHDVAIHRERADCMA